MSLLNSVKFGMGVFGLFIMVFLHADEATIRMEVVQGEAIHAYVKDITDLSLIIYREYPYLYEGTEEEYLPHIQHYAQPESVACLLFDNEKTIGVAIGLPLKAMRDNYKRPLLNSDVYINIDSVFYLGEILLLPEYRGRGLGKQMYLKFEEMVRKKENFKSICLSKISELESHPRMPAQYKSLDTFWAKLGFKRLNNVHFSVVWLNVGDQEESSHKMVYWIKTLYRS